MGSIDIPDSVTEIKFSAFEGCISLKTIHFSSYKVDDIVIDELAFDNATIEECVLYVPYGTKEKYVNHPVLGKFKNIEIEKI